jgi:hypothetical protein
MGFFMLDKICKILDQQTEILNAVENINGIIEEIIDENENGITQQSNVKEDTVEPAFTLNDALEDIQGIVSPNDALVFSTKDKALILNTINDFNASRVEAFNSSSISNEEVRKEIVENSALASTTLFVALGFPSGK